MMYFPYLRGRQFELIALRELAELDAISPQIIPIIEPIKPSATLMKTLDKFHRDNRELAVIHNPKVGNFKKEIKNLKNSQFKDQFFNYLHKKSIILSHILNKDTYSEMENILSNEYTKSNLLLIHKNSDNISEYLTNFKEEKPRFNVVADKISLRRKVNDNKILLSDGFAKLSRNADYLNVEDEFFSEDHLYYKEEKYLGFSDYSIVGEKFSESGFAPYAVAIHIVYPSMDDHSFRIKHFVSESNDDINDPAGKFYEALEKLYKWQSQEKLETHAMDEFVKHYKNETYPGLGTVKKLSIMHHIELVSKYLDGGSNDLL